MNGDGKPGDVKHHLLRAGPYWLTILLAGWGLLWQLVTGTEFLAIATLVLKQLADQRTATLRGEINPAQAPAGADSSRRTQ